jgi:hypothetical protein
MNYIVKTSTEHKPIPRLNDGMPHLFPADIVLTRGEGWMSKAIRWFGARKSGSSRVNHAAGAIDSRLVIESLNRVKVRDFWKAYADTPLCVWRFRRFTMDERNTISDLLLDHDSEGYGWGKIGLLALDSLIPGQHYPFSRWLGVSHFKVCSNLLAYSYTKATGKNWFGLNWRSVTPDAIDDFCHANPQDWQLVWDTLPMQQNT